MNKILVIKLSALGDMALASAPFAAIRTYHTDDHLTLLTTVPYRDFAHQMGYFDDIFLDPRLRLKDWRGLLQFRSFLLDQGFSRVYDLQMVDRTNFYFHALWSKKRPEWCGSARGGHVRYPFQNPSLHVLERYREFLRLCSMDMAPLPDLRHLAAPALPISLHPPFALLIPGASLAHDGQKRWTAEGFAAVGAFLQRQGIQPVIIGGPEEDNCQILSQCPEAIDLTGKTSFIDIVTLASQAFIAIGNDTGPLHVAAACHCPIVGLFPAINPPSIGGPIAPQTLHITHSDLKTLPPEEVIQKLKIFLSTLLK